MKHIIHILILAIFIFPSFSFAQTQIEDTPENRIKLAKKHFEIASISELMLDMGKEMASRMPPERRKSFLEYWEQFCTEERISVLKNAAIKGIAKHMTVVEILASTRFMEDPAGRSAAKKMKYYMADLMPVIQKLSIQAMTDYREVIKQKEKTMKKQNEPKS